MSVFIMSLKDSLANFGAKFSGRNAAISRSEAEYKEKSRLWHEPEGLLDYHFLDHERTMISGVLGYTFGVEVTGKYDPPRRFLFLAQVEGDLLERIINSPGQLEFFALAYLLNQTLNLNYNAISNNGVDLVVKSEGDYKELAIEYGAYSACPYDLGYADFIDEWLKKTKAEKIKILRESLEKSTEDKGVLK